MDRLAELVSEHYHADVRVESAFSVIEMRLIRIPFPRTYSHLPQSYGTLCPTKALDRGGPC